MQYTQSSSFSPISPETTCTHIHTRTYATEGDESIPWLHALQHLLASPCSDAILNDKRCVPIVGADLSMHMHRERLCA